MAAASIASIWTDTGVKFDYVINCAAETKYGHNDEVYKERVHHLSLSCAQEAAKQGVKRFIEVSTAQVYEATNKAKDESAKVDPWTNLAKWKLQVEEDIRKIPGLEVIIVRPAIVYGPGDRTGVGMVTSPPPLPLRARWLTRRSMLAPRIICGAIYKHLDKKMKFLWSGDLKINTVHVHDVAKALFHLCKHGEAGAVYNLSDKSNTGF